MSEESWDITRENLRIRRLRRMSFLLFKKNLLHLVPWLFGIFAVIWVSGLFFVRPVAKTVISRICNGAVYIETGRFKGLTGIRLKGVVIAENANALINDPIFKFDRIDVSFDPWKLLRGKLQANTIALESFLFIADYDAELQRWNFQDLYSKKSAPGKTTRIPFVTIRSGTLQVRRSDPNGVYPITTVGLNGQVTVETNKGQYSFNLESDGRFGFEGSHLEGLLKISRELEKSQLSMQGSLQMPRAVVFENSWSLKNMKLETEFDDKEVILKHCSFLMGDGQVDIQGSVRDDEHGREELNLDVNLQNLKLSDHYQKDAIVYSHSVLELLDPGLRRFLERYNPNGTGNMTLLIRGYLDDLSETTVNGTVVCRDISVRDDKFPYLLENMQGQIELSGRNLKLNQLKARHGDVNLLIDGSILNLGPTAEIDLRTTSDNMEFNEDLYKALNQSIKKVWYSFTPKGRTGVDYHFQRFADGNRDMKLTLELKNASLVYEHFPYPLENMTGRVEVKSESVELEEIISHYDDGRMVKLNGRVLDIKSPTPNFNIHIQAEDIPVDDLLINAMPPSQRTFLEELDIKAVADLNVVVFPNAVGKRSWDYIAKIRAEGEHLVYPEFPLLMKDVHLTADVTHEMVRLHHFDGSTAGGKVMMSGTLLPKGIEPSRPGLCMEMELEDFDFNDTFWEAAGEDANSILGKLRIQGRMNVKGHLAMNLSSDSCATTDLVIQCSDNPLLWDADLIGNASGQFHLHDKTIDFEDFRLNDIQLGSVPQELLNERLKDAYSSIEPQGQASLQIEQGMLQLAENRPEKFDIEGRIALENVSVGHEKLIHTLAGDIDGHLEFDRSKETWQALALCQIDHFNYQDWVVSNFQGNFVYDPNTKHFEASDFVADLYDGKMLGGIELDLSNEDQIGYKLGFSINQVDVSQLLASGSQDLRDRVSEGRASGVLNLEGDLKSLGQSNGKAVVEVVDMKLGTQSLMGKILTAMQFKRPEEYVFSELKANAVIRQSQIIIEDVRMVGKPLIFRGKGIVDLEQKQVQMDFVAYDRLVGNEDTILDLLARGIGSAVWKVEVRGDLNNPNVNAVFLSVLKQPIELFKKNE